MLAHQLSAVLTGPGLVLGDALANVVVGLADSADAQRAGAERGRTVLHSDGSLE